MYIANLSSSFNSCQSQRGAVLAVALILLLVITIVGLSTVQTTGLEEKMAANSQFKNMAFQASETAIEEALDDSQYLSNAYTSSVQSTSWPTKSVATSGASLTVSSEAQFIEVTRGIVEDESGTSISLDSNALLFYNYEIHGTATVNNTGSSNTNVQGAYIKSAAAGAY